jgi:hypothetical protein
MNILHLYPADNPLITQHVNMLGEAPDEAAPHIVHVHGCWHHATVRQAMQAHRRGARIVFTPHGGLEPWILSERRLSEKLCKTLLWQRRLVECSYVVIAQGRMEAQALHQLGWNPRIETIRNAVVTNSITPEAMSQHTRDVYRKVMDSNTVELMNADARRLLTLLLKAGITGDERWIADDPPRIDDTEWRRLLIYANHENVRTIVDRGYHLLGLRHDYFDTEHITSYLPTGYEKPHVEAHDVAGITAEMHRGRITLRHFAELDRALRGDTVDDEWLCDSLQESRLLKFFRRLLQVLTEVTALDEGFLPAEPLNDRGTQKIRNLLNNHLRI